MKMVLNEIGDQALRLPWRKRLIYCILIIRELAHLNSKSSNEYPIIHGYCDDLLENLRDGKISDESIVEIQATQYAKRLFHLRVSIRTMHRVELIMEQIKTLNGSQVPHEVLAFILVNSTLPVRRDRPDTAFNHLYHEDLGILLQLV